MIGYIADSILLGLLVLLITLTSAMLILPPIVGFAITLDERVRPEVESFLGHRLTKLGKSTFIVFVFTSIAVTLFIIGSIAKMFGA